MIVKIEKATQKTNFPLTIVTTIKDPKIYQKNLLDSTKEHKNEIEYINLYHNYSASSSLNIGLEIASNNIIMFCHQDIYFKDDWYNILKQHIQTLNNKQIKWGILGFAGTTSEGKMVGTHSGLGMDNTNIIPVQTLDGSILIFDKRNNLKFDENLKFFHMYDVDICLQAIERNLTNYCINVPINHISYQSTGGKFRESVKYIKEKWEDKIGLIYSTVGCINYMV